MIEQHTCPTRVSIQQLADGLLSVEEQAAVFSHVETCARCLQTIQEITNSDTLLSALRKSDATYDEAMSPLVEGLIERFSQSSQSTFTALSSLHDGGAVLSPPQRPDELGRLGQYRALRLLGAGGMGAVYEAEDIQLLRKVALKVMKPELARKPDARHRFLREAQSAAALDHDHIVHIYQVGEEKGVPFLAMQYLEGQSLDDHLKETGKLSVAAVVRISGQIVAALIAAHAKGVVHRDIKPANIWLECVPHHRVKILDIGLARIADSGESITQTGLILGTPAYMAPEQARGQAVDARADLFSLGCVMYEMVTGRRPFSGPDQMAILSSLALDTPVAPSLVNFEIPTELSDLIMQLLAKDPAQRPASAAKVAERLAAAENPKTLVLEPATAVAAAPLPAPAMRKRPPLRFVAVALGLLALSAAVLAGVIIIVKDKDGKVIATYKHKDDVKVEIVQDKPELPPLPPGKSHFDRFQAKDIPAAEKFDWQPKELVAVLGEHGGQRHWGFAAAVAISPDGKKVASRVPDGLRVWETATGRQVAYADRERLPGPGGNWVAFSPDGRLIATRAGEGPHQGRLLDATTLRERARIPSVAIAFAPDGRTLAFETGDGSITIWDYVAEKPVKKLTGHKTISLMLAYSRDGKTLASSGNDTTTKLWDVAAGKEFDSFLGGSTPLAISSDGKYLATGHQGGTLWDVASHKEILTISDRSVQTAFAPDDETIAGTDYHFSTPLRLWDSTRLLRTTIHHVGVGGVAYSSDGELIASTTGLSFDRAWVGSSPVALTDAGVGMTRHTLPPHKGPARAVAYSADGKLLASAGEDGKVRFHDPATGKEGLTLNGDTHEVQCLAISRDTKTVAAGTRDGKIRLFDASTGKPLRTIDGHTGSVLGLDFSPDQKSLISTSKDHAVKIWDPATGKLRDSLPGHAGVVHSVAYSRDGKLIATASDDRTARLWDAAGKELKVLEGHTGPVLAVAFAPDGKTAVTGSEDGTARVWDVETGKELHELRHWDDSRQRLVPVRSVAFAPDGKTLATGGTDGTVRLWLAGHDFEWITLHGHKDAVHSVAFAPDGKTIASAGQDGKVLVRHTPSPVPGWDYPPKTAEVLAVSPDGKLMVQRTWRGRLQLVDVASGKVRRSALGRIGMTVWRIGFSPDGKTLAYSFGQYGGTPSVRCLDVETGAELPFEGGWYFCFSADGALIGSSGGIWDLRARKEIAKVQVGHDFCSFTADAKALLTSGHNGKVRMWSVATGKELPTNSPVWDHAIFAPDGSTYVGRRLDGKGVLWDVASDKPRAEGDYVWGQYWPIYSPDSKTLAVVHGTDIVLTDVATGARRQILKGHTAGISCGSLGGRTFSSDSKLLATSGHDNRVILWNVADGKQIRSWTLPGVPTSVLFAPDNRHLIINNSNGTVYVLRLAEH